MSDRTMWLCLCICGNNTTIRGSSLTTGNTLSCGCLREENIKNGINRKHGMCHTSEYRCWAHIISRCTNPLVQYFFLYGGRGITVCNRWHTFENFFHDMGYKPSPAHSIDRIDNNGNYEPGNCRWATSTEQSNNKRNNKRITNNGLTLTSAEWARKLGGSASLINSRIKLGWSEEKAVTMPLRPMKKREAA